MPGYFPRLIFVLLSFFFMRFADSSVGDRSYVFQKCIKDCFSNNCNDSERFYNKQSIYLFLLGWTCNSECQQKCMWHTVDAFMNDGSPIPQFYGKWPFVQMFGLQEPASVFISIFNFISHLSVLQYRRSVSSATPMYYVWHGFAFVSMHAWTWSMIYHAKDTVFNEMMDYFVALSTVMYNMFATSCRVLGTDHMMRVMFVAAVLLVMYVHHLYSLIYIKFDYGYNMQFNVFVGIWMVSSWLLWCYANRRFRHVWICALTMIFLVASMTLELLDFPPVYFVLDAHALWHATTIPINLLMWSLWCFNVHPMETCAGLQVQEATHCAMVT